MRTDASCRTACAYRNCCQLLQTLGCSMDPRKMKSIVLGSVWNWACAVFLPRMSPLAVLLAATMAIPRVSADGETPYVVPTLSSGSSASPVADMQAALSESAFQALECMVADPALDTDGDGFTDLQESLCGSDADDANSTPDKFNLALSMAGDWTTDKIAWDAGSLVTNDANNITDLNDRLTQLGAGSAPVYLPGLSPTLETQFDLDLARLAKTLNYDAVAIYEWVCRSIEFEDYQLSRKGALATYRSGRGNEWDQCSLLIALCRMSGIPARYVAGHTYLSVQGAPDNTALKDVVLVQVWVNAGPVAVHHPALTTACRGWVTLVPWYKTVRVQRGIDIFHNWTDANSNGVVDPGEVANMAVPAPFAALMGTYLSPAKPTNAQQWDVFETHTQQNAVEYFEKQLQDYITASFPGKSLKDVPRRETIVLTPAAALPCVIPRDLVTQVIHKTAEDTADDVVTTDIADFAATTLGSKRAKADVQFCRLPATNIPGLIGWWRGDDGTANGSATATDSTGSVWNATLVNSAECMNYARRGAKAFRLNATLEDDGSFAITASTTQYLRLAGVAATAPTNLFAHQAYTARTVAMWILVATNGTSGTHVLYDEGGSSAGCAIRICDGKLQAAVAFPKDGGTVVKTAEVEFGSSKEGQWHHIAVTFAGTYPQNGEAGAILFLIDGGDSVYFSDSYGYTYDLAASTDAAGLGARVGSDAFGATETGDCFTGLLDDIQVYNRVLAAREIRFIMGSPLIDCAGERALALPQAAGRRVTLDFALSTRTIGGTVTDVLVPCLKLDGAAWAANDDYNGCGYLYVQGSSGAVAYPSNATFCVTYRNAATANWTVRPAIRSGAFLNLTLDSLAASQARINELAQQLGMSPTAWSFSTDLPTRENYLGRMSALLAETFNLRFTEATRRVDDLINVKRLHPDAARAFTILWTYPGDQTGLFSTDSGNATPATSRQIDHASPLALAAGWRIDSVLSLASVYSPDNPCHVEETIWDASQPTSVGLGRFAAQIAGCAASYNEARVFEDWQGTAALSTVAGIFMAIADINNDNNQIVVMNNRDMTAAQIKNQLSLAEATENSIVQEVQNGARVTVAVNDVSILYPDDYPDPLLRGQRAVTSDVRIVEDNNDIAWLYGQFNGGRSDQDKDEAEWNARLTAKSDNAVARTVYAGGDPVDLVTGEFYLQEPADIALKTRGSALGITRKYLSQSEYDNGPFGYGWTWNLNERITASAGDSQITYSDPETRSFEFSHPQLTDSCYWYTSSDGHPVIWNLAGVDFSAIGFKAGDLVQVDIPGHTWTLTILELLTNTVHHDTLKLSGSSSGAATHDTTLTCLSTWLSVPRGVTLKVNVFYENSLKRYSATTREGSQSVFDATGLLIRKTDSNGNTIHIEYGTGPYTSRISRVYDDTRSILWFSYQASNPNLVTSITDQTGRAVHYEYSGYDLVAFTDALGNTWRYEYLHDQENPECDHNLCKQTLPDGDWLQINYYKNDTVASHTNKAGSTFNFQYSWYNRYTETWTETGYYRKVFYNQNWDVTRVETEDKTLEISAYDDAHNLCSRTDGNGSTTTYAYDVDRNLTAVTDANGNSWFYKYETIGGQFSRMTAQIDPNGVLGQFYYDNQGRLVRAEAAVKKGVSGAVATGTGLVSWSGGTNCAFPECGTICFWYDAYGNLIRKVQFLAAPNIDSTTNQAKADVIGKFLASGSASVTLSESNVVDSHFYYDGTYSANLLWSVDPRGNTTGQLYDYLGRVVSATDAAGFTSHVEYNAADLPLRQIAADGGVTDYVYDVNRRLVQTTHPNGAVTETAWGSRFYTDEKCRVLAEIDALGNAVTHEYDAAGNRISSTDRNGNTSLFTYDALGRLVETVDALGNSALRQYDGNGNLIAVTDPRGFTTRFMYDAANRQVIKFEAWGDRRATKTEYDAAGNATITHRGVMNTTKGLDALAVADFTSLDFALVAYDARNHRISETRNAGGDADEQDVTETDYDSLGRVITVREGDGSGFLRRTRFEYDNNGNKLATYLDAWENSAWSEKASTSATYDARNLAVTATDARGVTATIAYDASGRETTRSLGITPVDEVTAVAHSTRTWHDTMGNVILTQDFIAGHAGAWSAASYNLRNEKVTVTDTYGHTSAFTYDANGNLVATTDPDGYVTWAWYDAVNRVVAKQDALGNCAWTEYDAVGNAAATIDALGNRTAMDYDGAGRVLTVTDPLGNTASRTYDTRGRPATVTDALGQTVTTTYSNLDQPLTVSTTFTVHNSDGSTTANQAVTTTTAYDALGRATLVTDPLGVQTETTYNVLDKPLSVTQAKGVTACVTVATYTYDNAGNLLSELRNSADSTLANRQKTADAYDEAGRRTKTIVVNPANETETLVTKTRYYWTSSGNNITGSMITTTDPYGVAVITYLDLLGRKYSTTDAAGNTTAYSYDNRGNLIQVTPPIVAETVTTQYDALNRPVAVTQNGDTVTTAYDELGRIAATCDARGTSALICYDAAGRKIMTVDAAGTADEAVTKFQYDANGNLLKVIDANHTNDATLDVAVGETALVTYAYDELNRRWMETDPDSSYQTITLDASGHAIAARLRDGRVISRVFDALSRCTDVNVGSTALQKFGYDRLSRMTYATDYNADVASANRLTHTVEFAYDFAGRTTEETEYDMAYPRSGAPWVRTVTTARSAPGTAGTGLSASATLTYPAASRQFQRQKDTAGRLWKIKDMNTANLLAQWTFDTLNRPVAGSAYNTGGSSVFTASFGYDGRGRENGRSFTATNGSTNLFIQGVTLDGNGNLTAESATGSAAMHTGQIGYDHDPLNRLTLANNPGAETDLSWGYDREGNWLATNQNGAAETRSVNAENEYSGFGGSSGVSAGTCDAKGNIGSVTAGGQTAALTYDWANRLVKVIRSGVTTAYTYDALNRRLTKQVGSSSVITYGYENAHIVQEFAGQTLQRTYVYGQGVDTPVLMIDETTTGTPRYYYLQDRRFSVVGLVNASGAVVASYAYSPFGTRTAYGDAVLAPANPWGFTGRQWDAESGLWYYRNRMYSDALGRFLQRDPAGFVDGSNVYAYVRNCPLTLSDPLGLRPYGTDFVGPLTPLDWSVSEYNDPRLANLSQTQVDSILGYMSSRDTILWQSGLGCPLDEQRESRNTVSAIFGMPVTAIPNYTLSEPFYQLGKLGQSMESSGWTWNPLGIAGSVVGTALDYASIALRAGAVFGADVPIAALDKNWAAGIGLSWLDPITYRTSSAVQQALERARSWTGPGDAAVLYLAHSDGAIHAANVLNTLSQQDLNDYFMVFPVGPGTLLFSASVRNAKDYQAFASMTEPNGLFRHGMYDIVPLIAGGEVIRSPVRNLLNWALGRDDQGPTVVETDARWWPHGADTYLRFVALQLARDRYFAPQALKYLHMQASGLVSSDGLASANGPHAPQAISQAVAISMLAASANAGSPTAQLGIGALSALGWNGATYSTQDSTMSLRLNATSDRFSVSLQGGQSAPFVDRADARSRPRSMGASLTRSTPRQSSVISSLFE